LTSEKEPLTGTLLRNQPTAFYYGYEQNREKQANSMTAPFQKT
jgi:hypothetical protein